VTRELEDIPLGAAHDAIRTVEGRHDVENVRDV